MSFTCPTLRRTFAVVRLAVAVGILVAVLLAWNAGEQHRSNCIRADRTSCTILPWDAGQSATSSRLPRGVSQAEVDALRRAAKEAAAQGR